MVFNNFATNIVVSFLCVCLCVSVRLCVCVCVCVFFFFWHKCPTERRNGNKGKKVFPTFKPVLLGNSCQCVDIMILIRFFFFFCYANYLCVRTAIYVH